MRSVEGSEDREGLPVVWAVTGNEGKLREFKALGKSLGVRVERASAPKLEVQDEDLVKIAVFSATLAKTVSELPTPAFVEDAGLFIDALKGFPGPYSSYVLKTLGINGVLKLMKDVEDRRACFRSAIALVLPDGNIKTFTGLVNGFIAREARGRGGFGFDPIFIPEGYDLTFAEMRTELKNRISHRGKAFRSMVEWLRANSF